MSSRYGAGALSPLSRWFEDRGLDIRNDIGAFHRKVKDWDAGRLPSQKFGANATWFIANAISYSIFSTLRSAEKDAKKRVARVKACDLTFLLPAFALHDVVVK